MDAESSTKRRPNRGGRGHGDQFSRALCRQDRFMPHQLGNAARANIVSPTDCHRDRILQNIHSHRLTFLQGDTGCGKSSAIPQYILDDAADQGRGDSVRVIVTQPRRIAAVSLGRYVSRLRGGKVGMDVGYAVAHDRAASARTRLTYVTTGYLLSWLGRERNQGRGPTHIILDEVHVRSVEQDLLLLLLKLSLRGTGKLASSMSDTRLIIMSATMDVGPLQAYFHCLLKTGEDPAKALAPILVGGRRFPLVVVHIDEMLQYLPSLPKPVADLASRLVGMSGKGERALDGTQLPRFAVDLVTGLIRHEGRAGDSVLVFLASLADILEIQQGFDRSVKARRPIPPLEVMFLHSSLSREEQEMAIQPAHPGTLKVLLATNIAESSLSVPSVRVVIDLGHHLQRQHHRIGDNARACPTLTRVWCSKASARQRSGRAGRMFPGVAFRLFTRETFRNLLDYDKPEIALENLGSTILSVKSWFQCFPTLSVSELLQQLLDSPHPEEVGLAVADLQNSGAIDLDSKNTLDFQLTLLGRLGVHLGLEIDLARFIFVGVLMGCGVDCVVMAAGMSLPGELFHRGLRLNRGSVDPLIQQGNIIGNMKARMYFDGGYYSDLLVYRQVYLEWIHASFSQYSMHQWIKISDLQPSRLEQLLITVQDYSRKMVSFLHEELGQWCQQREALVKFERLADMDTRGFVDRGHCVQFFCRSVAVLQIAIAGAFSRNLLIGSCGKNLKEVSEVQEFEEANMPAHLSFKLRNVPPNLAAADLGMLAEALKVLGPCSKIAPSGNGTVLVQCLLPSTGINSQAVIIDLPTVARMACSLAKTYSQNGRLIFYSKDNQSSNTEVKELFVGCPSGARTIKWTMKMGEELRKVQFNRLSLIPGAVETRRDVAFHIAVAANLSYRCDSSEVFASQVTVLPQDHPFSLLVLLLFRPFGPEGALHIRILGKEKLIRIFSVRYRATVLELAPRYICMETLNSIEILRRKIQGFMAGKDMQHCYVKAEVLKLRDHVLSIDCGAPVPAPDVGPWLTYPTLSPVQKENCKPQEFCSKPKAGVGQEHPGSLGMSSPVLVLSRKDLPTKLYQSRYQAPSFVRDEGRSAELQLFEQTFAAARIELDRRKLLQWLQGSNTDNGIFFELLKSLFRMPHSEDVEGQKKVVLEYVYSRQHELVNRKQRKELEGWYHSICNPDEAHSTTQNAFGARASHTVQVRGSVSYSKVGAVEGQTRMSLGDSDIVKQVNVTRDQRDLLINALEYQRVAAKVTFGSFSALHNSGLVTVVGQHRDVELILKWIDDIIYTKSLTGWLCADVTYLDSNHWEQMVQCVTVNGAPHESLNPVLEKSNGRVQFMLVQDTQGGIIPECATRTVSLYHTQMKELFDEALQEMGPSDSVELQGRLGRVIFQCWPHTKRRLPFQNGQPMRLGRLRPFMDRHDIQKQKFNDSIPEEDFYHLRACLHLCHPKAVQRKKSIAIVVACDGEKAQKFRIVDAPEAPGRFHLESSENKRRLVAVDIVRLNAGATEADLRLCMQTKEEHVISEEAHNYVKGILRRGSKLEFPAGPYVVQVQRHKSSEILQFEGLMISLSTVKQIRGVSEIKYEVEFEAVKPCIEGSNLELPVPLSALTSKIPFVLQQIQSVCSQLCWIGPSTAPTGVAHAILRSWTAEHDEDRIRHILMSEFLPASPKSEVVGADQEQTSLSVCSLVETLCHCDGAILKEGKDVAAELQWVLLRIIRSMCISLSKSVEGRVKRFLTNHKMDPENALRYACLFKCHCSSLDWTWDKTLAPYVMQLMLEQRVEIFKELSPVSLNIHLEFLDCSSNQLLDLIVRSSTGTVFSALTRLFQRQSIGPFLKLFNVIVTYGEAVAPLLTAVKPFIYDLFSFQDLKAATFVCRCLEWVVGNEMSIMDLKASMQTVGCLLEMLKKLDVIVDDNCRSNVLDLLLRLPSFAEGKRSLEEGLLQVFGITETQFRNIHYQEILRQLGWLQGPHKQMILDDLRGTVDMLLMLPPNILRGQEMERRGLNASQCFQFNFRRWTTGKIRGRDVSGSTLIPGMDMRGSNLLGRPGIFIPARDPYGHIVGGQIKVDNPVKGMKYIWLSSYKSFDGGKGPDINGDLPLFCCIPREIDISTVGLCEGGLKAHVLAALSGLPVIGASGADFPRSKNLLKSYLALIDIKQVLFFPDAGSQRNDQVTRNYFRTFRLLRDWGYNVSVAWWGQVNKEEHDDIDDYLAKHNSTIELPLLPTYQFWQILDVDVQMKLQSEFPEYEKPQVYTTRVEANEEAFTDDDLIQILKMPDVSTGSHKTYQVIIPKHVMTKMPRAPDGHVTPQSVETFTIEVIIVQMDDPVGVDAAIDWLLPVCEANIILGLDCEHGLNGDLNLIQLSTHQRCILLQMRNGSFKCSSRLTTILSDKEIIKSGAEVHNDALAIYSSTGAKVNGFKNISPIHKDRNRTRGMLEIFRSLYGWEWRKRKYISRSEWGCAVLSLEQVKYAALDAWASRMIALEGPAIPRTSLEDLPEDLLKLFARAITSSGALQSREKNIFETAGTVIEGSRSTLRLMQASFQSRVMGKGCRVELRFNDGQEPALFEAQYCTGKSVVLAPVANKSKATVSSAESSTTGQHLPINVSSIGSIIVDNSNRRSWQDQKLREAFYDLLCFPKRCPQHLLLALKCGDKKNSKKRLRAAFPQTTQAVLPKPTFETCLNPSQLEALHQILTSPLSATIGPPGTGKTRLITALARAWMDARGKSEILLCTAYQNVGVRHLVEALLEANIPSVLLLVSEDYFVEWHENLYETLARSVVITKNRCELPGALEDWRARNKSNGVAIIACTLALVGSPAFVSSLMRGQVTAMVIDECSQASEGSCIHPLTCLPNLSLLTVLGDPHQLPPFGSGVVTRVPSIFDLVSNGCCDVKLLREQYRMPPIISDFISSKVYGNELRTAKSRCSEKDWQRPLVWINVPGVAARDPGNPSAFNTAEADAILRFCQKLAVVQKGEKKVVVLTLYEEQNRRISQLLVDAHLQKMVDVHNVDSFQGQQSDIILISLVAGKDFSAFAADRQRACVMLSRVRRFLCVFGNHGAVKRNTRAEMWNSLAKFCEDRGFVIAPEDMDSTLPANLPGIEGSANQGLATGVPSSRRPKSKPKYARKEPMEKQALSGSRIRKRNASCEWKRLHTNPCRSKLSPAHESESNTSRANGSAFIRRV